MSRIRRFGVVKTATVVAVMYMLMIGIVFVPLAVIVVALGRDNNAGGAFAVLVIGLLAAIAYGIGSWIFTALACVLYNVAARWTGGIEVQVESVTPQEPVQVWRPTAPPPPARPPAG